MEMTRRNVSHSLIYDYWIDKAITDRGEIVFEADADFEHTVPAVDLPEEPHCWGCGKPVKGIQHLASYQRFLDNREFRKMYNLTGSGARLNRCHIIPFACGGSDEPSNLFLLCEECHHLSPDTDDPRNFFLWVYNKRQEEHFSFDGWNFGKVIDQVNTLCKQLGKDPLSGDVSKMNVMNHGNSVSESSIVYGYVGTCKSITEE